MFLTASDIHRLKIWCILERCGEAVLRYTLECGTDGKDPAVPLDKYLENLPPSSTSNYRSGKAKVNLNKYFNDTDKSQIAKYPSFTHFDITLLYKSIKVACENVAGIHDRKWKDTSDEMEYLVTKIKDTRNENVHEKQQINEQEFLSKVAELKNLFVKALKATKVRYGRDVNEFINKDKVINDADSMRDEILGEEEILKRSANDFLSLFKEETDKEVREKLERATSLNPLNFLSDDTLPKPVTADRIFSEVEIKQGGIPSGKCNDINYMKILNQVQAVGLPASCHGGLMRPQVLVIEGDAGSGKTTLVTFLLAEWLKADHERRMEGLHCYDFLLRVVCREENSPSLESMVQKALPKSNIKFGHLLLPLLKQRSLLILIDGLDERNADSYKLVTDILSHGKDCTNFTVVCTSRPESVKDMKENTPTSFQISHVKLTGIALKERTEFVVRHYEWLTEGKTRDTARLRQLMQQIDNKELFRLPLNLLFLCTIFHYHPEKLTATITQSELYQSILDWSVEKLQNRLATHQTYRRTRQKYIEKVLKVIREVALQGLLQERLYLSKEDEEKLSSCWPSKDLLREVLPAFYSLRREVIAGVVKERYCAPHKGLQEFFAAQHIIEQLVTYKREDIRNFLQDMSRKDLRLKSLTDTVWHLLGLQESTAEKDLIIHLRPLRNMFCHLLGLLNRQESPVTEAMEEAVDLLQMSGVRQANDWLEELKDTELHRTTKERVGHHIKIIKERDIGVTDGTMHVAAALLPFMPRMKVLVHLRGEPPEDTYALGEALTGHIIKQLSVDHHF